MTLYKPESHLKLIALFLISFTVCSPISAQEQGEQNELPDTLEVSIRPDDPVIAAMDSLWADERIHWQNFEPDSTCLNVYNFAPGVVPEYSDSIIEARLAALNALTPLELEYNQYVHAFIRLYAEKRRGVTSRVLGLSELYYPLFEDKLDQFNMPLELKHLAVVESALKPTAKSRVGATGLWQFMYSTGKIYDLEVNSYVDDRKDPYKATIAACRYMTYLYKIYGDWNLVLAAYNSGPGNVNKAIRRSGGKKTYWEIRSFLPRETRGYVPAFIAVNYIMNYSVEHNLYPSVPDFIYSEIDTIQVCNREMTFDQISHFTNVSIEELAILNPSMKRNIIPASEDCYTLYLPTSAVGAYIANEDSIHLHQRGAPQVIDGKVVEEIVETYTVRSGDVLGLIAQRNGVSVTSLREWNNIRGNNIYPGQKLSIYKTKSTPVAKAAEKTPPPAENKVETGTKSVASISREHDFHTIQSGDTLWDIAKKYPGITVTDIKEANSGLNYNNLKPGQKIKIPKT